ncbi:hypothetical protein [Pseudomonas asplenii]|uniref:hypothetical protein n=1 Tax=Pseudomonas asplenii TaxID=53407 RepID=UPI000364157A|nr:hypothetical protein [Pseudomonas fuscovaginae]
MDIKKVVDTAYYIFAKRFSVQKLFWIAPQIADYCADECFRLAQSDTLPPAEPEGIDKAPAWQQISALVCRVEFDEVMARLKAQRLARR